MRARRVWYAILPGLLASATSLADPPGPAVTADVLRDWEAARRDARTLRPPEEPPGPRVFPLESVRLANGLEVVLAPWGRDARVRVSVTYRVGDGDAPPGRLQAAHAAEHLLFRDAPGLPNLGEALSPIAAGRSGGVTYSDRTVYEGEVEPEHLERLLWLEGARMAHAERFVRADSLARELPILQHEAALTTTRWRFLRGLALRGALPAAHRSHATWGAFQALDPIGVDDVLRVVRERYSPGNARLVVAGRFDPARVRPWIERYFAGIPARPVPARPRLDDPFTLPAARWLRARTVHPATVVMAWPGPASDDCQDAPLHLLSTVVRRAVAARPAFGAPDPDAPRWGFEHVRLGAHTFVVFEARASVGGSHEATRRAMDEALAGALASLASARSLDRALLTSVDGALADESRDLAARTARIAERPSADDPGGFRCARRAARTAEPAALHELARRWLTPRRLVIDFHQDATVVGLRVDAAEVP